MADCNYISDYFWEHIWSRFVYGLKSEKTVSFYRSVITDICNLCEKDFCRLDLSCAEAYRTSLRQRGLQETTIELYLRVLRSIATFIEENKLVSGYRNPFIALQFHTNAGFYEDIEIPTLEDMSLMLQTAKVNENSVAFLAMVLTFRCCLAPSELPLLTRGDFQFPYSLNLIIKGNNFKRTIQVPEDVINCIEGYDDVFFHSADQSLPLFRKKNGTPLSLRALQHNVKLVADAAGTEVTLQKLRNLGILELMRANIHDLNRVKKYTGLEGRWLFRYEKCLMERTLQDIQLPHIKIEL